MILFCFLFYYSRKLFKNLSNSMCFFIFRFFSVYIFLVCVCPFVFMYAKRKKFAVLLTSTLSIRRIKQQNNRVASPSRHFSSSTAAFSISFLILVLTLVLLFFFRFAHKLKWHSSDFQPKCIRISSPRHIDFHCIYRCFCYTNNIIALNFSNERSVRSCLFFFAVSFVTLIFGLCAFVCISTFQQLFAA